MGKWIHRAFLLATNLVPLVGVLRFGWSASTLLAVFWAETLLSGSSNLIRIWLHRRLTGTRGHWRLHLRDSAKGSPEGIGLGTTAGSFLQEYAIVLFVFTFAHGLFLGLFLLILNHNWTGEGPSPWRIDPDAFRTGILLVGALTLVELLYDGVSLGQQPFSWLKARVHVALGRVVILHLVIIGGVFLMMRFETPLTFLSVLVGLKALWDLGMSAAPGKISEKPPRWIAAIGRHQGIDMDREWERILREQKRREEQDELTLTQ